MPLEIRELHIRVNVNQPQQGSQGNAGDAGGGDSDKKKDALINQCIEEVMDILKNKNER
jgi:hypothetical protein